MWIFFSNRFTWSRDKGKAFISVTVKYNPFNRYNSKIIKPTVNLFMYYNPTFESTGKLIAHVLKCSYEQFFFLFYKSDYPTKFWPLNLLINGARIPPGFTPWIPVSSVNETVLQRFADVISCDIRILLPKCRHTLYFFFSILKY